MSLFNKKELSKKNQNKVWLLLALNRRTKNMEREAKACNRIIKRLNRLTDEDVLEEMNR